MVGQGLPFWSRNREGGTMRQRIQALALVVAVVGGLAVATRVAEANHASRTLQVPPGVVSPSAAPGPGQALTAELSVAADGFTGPIEIDFEVESGPGDTDGASRTSPDFSCTVTNSTQCTTAPI